VATIGIAHDDCRPDRPEGDDIHDDSVGRSSVVEADAGRAVGLAPVGAAGLAGRAPSVSGWRDAARLAAADAASADISDGAGISTVGGATKARTNHAALATTTIIGTKKATTGTMRRLRRSPRMIAPSISTTAPRNTRR
jgi:hypothetical protein